MTAVVALTVFPLITTTGAGWAGRGGVVSTGGGVLGGGVTTGGSTTGGGGGGGGGGVGGGGGGVGAPGIREAAFGMSSRPIVMPVTASLIASAPPLSQALRSLTVGR